MIRLLLFLAPAAYQALALAAGVRQLSRTRRAAAKFAQAPSPSGNFYPGVSVLKPLRGLDPNTLDAFRSQAEQNYRPYELLFGISDSHDPAAAAVRQLQRDFPGTHIHLVVGGEDAANGKVGVLAALARRAQYPIWVVNDSDIRVGPDYLRRVTAPLADPTVGVVTCPYRALAHNVPSTWEALGIATDFIPSALVATLVGVREFGFGSTLAFRADELAAAGGFDSLKDYIADDYHLARSLTAGSGKRAEMSTYVVETALSDDTWAGIWRHQLRWARTIRASKAGGHAGLPLTHAGVFALALALAGARRSALALWALRSASAFVSGVLLLRSNAARRLFWAAPLWDWYAFAIWCTSYASRRVHWRDRLLTIGPEGRIR